MYVLVVLFLSLSLQTVNKAEAPVHEGTNVVGQNNPNVKQNGASSNAPLAPPQQSPASQGDSIKTRAGDKEPERPMAVSGLPDIVIKKDFFDYIAIACTFFLFIVGIGGVYVAVGTLKTIQKQTHFIKRQAILMRRSTEATEKSIRMQETQLKQWIDVDGIVTRVNHMQGRVPEGTTQTPLFISFDISNPTGMVLILNWVIVRIDGKGRNRNFSAIPLIPAATPLPFILPKFWKVGLLMLTSNTSLVFL
jgi:hypothetical protein